MLSHLVGAANRADIQRLRQLEEENAALAEKIERQQQQLRDGFTSRDETIRRLSDALARKAGEERPIPKPRADEAGRWRRRWPNGTNGSPARLRGASDLRNGLRRLSPNATKPTGRASGPNRECEAMRLELASVESRIGMLVAGRRMKTPPAPHPAAA